MCSLQKVDRQRTGPVLVYHDKATRIEPLSCKLAGFDVNKVGDARVGLVGFPSVGKSTLLTKLTGTMSEVSVTCHTTHTKATHALSYTVCEIVMQQCTSVHATQPMHGDMSELVLAHGSKLLMKADSPHGATWHVHRRLLAFAASKQYLGLSCPL